MLNAQLNGAHDLRRLYLFVRNLASFADASVTNFSLLVRFVGCTIRTVAQLE